MAAVTRRRKHNLKAEPVGFADTTPSPSTRFEQTDEERMFARAHLRTQKALLGEIGGIDASLVVHQT